MPLNSFQEEFLHALRDGYEQEMAEASDTARCKFLVHNLLKPQHVPARVEAKVPLLVKASSAKPHGYGIFIKEPVKAGELVFKVKKPMLNIVGDGESDLSNTCDYCFTAKFQDISSKHSPSSIHQEDFIADMRPKFMRCGGCLAEGEKTLLHQLCMRLVIRLLLLRENNMISDEDWQEVKRLPTERKAKLADRNLCQISQACAVLLCSMKISKMEYEEVRDIFYMTFQNQRNLTVPLIKGHSYLPLGDAVHIAGVTFEPFTSTIAHSCNPNCWIIFEGHELCLRALRDITAFEELTVTYVPEFWDQLGQQSILRNRFNIECQCELCAMPSLNVSNSLKNRILEILNMNSYSASNPGLKTHFTKFIKDMESEGLGWDVPATLFLHQSATLQYLFSGNTSECLKRSMKARGKISHRTGLTRH
ncbi:SET [Glarea lozoyensis ATCC 20868]|uniref:SET n=1 Tax=Glarea lozoyensis (strain ATCC 20868 / MF5171) TaxID=1116229 RepID=S3E3Y0_GLAL2|nr:SET [Glarea lozoyensis ATCC 20868]EPE33158.1 SET [Glarea lozoyensis ATCC 20868]